MQDANLLYGLMLKLIMEIIRLKEKARQKQRLKQLQQQMEIENGHSSPHSISEDDPGSPLYSSPSTTTYISKSSIELAKRALPPVPTPYYNIAIDLDPTYNKRNNNLEENGIHFAQLCRVSPATSPSESPTSTATRSKNPSYEDEDFRTLSNNMPRSISPVPPYMPVQGQRRIVHQDKVRNKKNGKDACKTQ